MITSKAAATMRHVILSSVLIAGFASAASAQSLPPQPRPEPSAPAKGTGEGISVHGHWAIDVRNPDGTLARHVEFENALSDGGSTLGRLLARTTSLGYWTVFVFDRQDAPCKGGTWPVFNDVCASTEAGGTSVSGSNVTKNLVLSNAGVNQVKVVLTGSTTALSNGKISEVASYVGQCGSPSAPATPGGCGSAFSAMSFTQAILPQSITVVQGQIIQITVTFSFS